MSKIVSFDLTARFLFPDEAPELPRLRDEFIRFETQFHSALQSYFGVENVSHQRVGSSLQAYESEWWLEADDVAQAIAIYRSLTDGPATEFIEILASAILSVVVPNKPKVSVLVGDVSIDVSDAELWPQQRPVVDQQRTGGDRLREHLAWQLRRLTPTRALVAILIGFALVFLYNAGLKLIDAWADNLRGPDHPSSGPSQLVEVQCPPTAQLDPPPPAAARPQPVRRTTTPVVQNYTSLRDCPQCPVVTHMGVREPR